jgi:hypothetical protein
MTRRFDPYVDQEDDVLETRWGCNGCILTGHCKSNHACRE